MFSSTLIDPSLVLPLLLSPSPFSSPYYSSYVLPSSPLPSPSSSIPSIENLVSRNSLIFHVGEISVIRLELWTSECAVVRY